MPHAPGLMPMAFAIAVYFYILNNLIISEKLEVLSGIPNIHAILDLYPASRNVYYLMRISNAPNTCCSLLVAFCLIRLLHYLKKHVKKIYK